MESFSFSAGGLQADQSRKVKGLYMSMKEVSSINPRSIRTSLQSTLSRTSSYSNKIPLQLFTSIHSHPHPQKTRQNQKPSNPTPLLPSLPFPLKSAPTPNPTHPLLHHTLSLLSGLVHSPKMCLNCPLPLYFLEVFFGPGEEGERRRRGTY